MSMGFPKAIQQNDPPLGGIALDVSGGDQTPARNVRWFYCSAAGHLHVTMVDGSAITLSNLVAGSIYPLRVMSVFQTGTTATGVLLY